jgi:diguanylate cyclase (GGDEF)-like protein
MHPIVKPIFYLMNQLSYSGKLMLLCSVFAIPLLIFAIQLASTHHQRTDQAEVTRNGLAYIQKSTLLINQLETLRDLKVITAWRAYPDFETRYAQTRISVLQQIDDLARQTEESDSLMFLKDLKNTIEADGMAKGTESASIDAVFDNAQQVLDKIYNWRAKLSYRFVSLSHNNTHVLSIINLLNDMDHYTKAIGEARAYGSLYLAQQFIDSHGIEVLEKVYQTLSHQAGLSDIKDAEYHPFFSVYPQAKLSSVKTAMLQGRELLYQKLIMATGANSNPVSYFDAQSDSLETVYAYKQSLFDLSTKIVEQDYRHSVQQLGAFYFSALFIVLLLTYLVIGLYYSVSITIRELLKAAKAFSAGDYDEPVKIVSNDELIAVAEAMDIMRINIKEREEKLALISQTDGLTRLSNRKFFDQALQISLANSRRNMTPLSLLMMDVDHFKKVNDDYGHLAGDACLIRIAELMQARFQRQTDVVARYGGEEFIAILYGQSLEDALSQAEKLRQEIENATIVFEDMNIKVTASFGLVALTPPQEAQAQDLIALADALLYQSKDHGRNQISSQEYRNPL